MMTIVSDWNSWSIDNLRKGGLGITAMTKGSTPLSMLHYWFKISISVKLMIFSINISNINGNTIG